ncbi:MAG TPA: ABC transporter substrate-binding protein [Patescibacteria group bacterium]
MRFKIILILGVVFGILVFIIFRFLAPLLFDKTVEKIGETGRYSATNLPTSILELVGDGLTKIDSEGIPQPSLAKSWESTDNGKTWTFHLREDAHWQDKTKVTSADISYNFEDVQIKKPDNNTVVFTLASPFTPFPGVVSRPVFKKGLLGTGEWKVSDLSVTGNYVQSLTLVDKDGNKKIFKFYPTEDRVKLAYKLGEIDVIDELIDPSPFNTNSWKTSELEPLTDNQRYVGVFFNTLDDNLKDKNLRQALAYAINKEALGFKRAYGPLSPASWAYNPQVKPYDFDVARAKELINDSKQLSDEQKKNLKIKLVTTLPLLPIAEKVANDWKAIGVATTVSVTQSVPSDFQAFLAMYDIPSDPDQYSTWHPQGAENITHYTNTRIGKLLEDGRMEIDQEKRKKIYLDFQRYLVEDAPVAFLYHPITYKLVRK